MPKYITLALLVAIMFPANAAADPAVRPDPDQPWGTNWCQFGGVECNQTVPQAPYRPGPPPTEYVVGPPGTFQWYATNPAVPHSEWVHCPGNASTCPPGWDIWVR